MSGETDASLSGRRLLTEVERDLAAELGPHGAVGVGDRVVEPAAPRSPVRTAKIASSLHAPAELGTRALHLDVLDEAASARPVSLRASCSSQSRSTESARGVARLLAAQQVGASDRFVQGAKAERREQTPHLFGHEVDVGRDHLRRSLELRAKIRTLRRDPHRTGVAVTRAHHDAALGEERRRSERVLVGAEQRGDDHVTSGAEPAVDAHTYARTQAFGDERLLRLGQTDLPREPGVLDRRQRRRTGAAVGAGEHDDLGETL